MSQNTNNLAAYIWSLADLLRGDFRQSQYGRIIPPFTLLRRLECVLESSKEAVLKQVPVVEKMKLPEEAQEKLLLRATGGLSFFNTSPMDLGNLGEAGIKANLERYIQCFSRDAREIFDYFKFAEFIGLLNDANLLYKIVQKVKATDLSLKAVSNHDMGLVFEELIRRFAESSNDTAGEHFIILNGSRTCSMPTPGTAKSKPCSRPVNCSKPPASQESSSTCWFRENRILPRKPL